MPAMRIRELPSCTRARRCARDAATVSTTGTRSAPWQDESGMVDVCLLKLGVLENRDASVSITLARGSHTSGPACTKAKEKRGQYSTSLIDLECIVMHTEVKKSSAEAQAQRGRSKEEISRGRSRTVYVYDRHVCSRSPAIDRELHVDDSEFAGDEDHHLRSPAILFGRHNDQ